MCDPYVKEHFLTAIPQSSRTDIQPCIVSSVDFSFKIVLVDWQKCGLGLNQLCPTQMAYWAKNHITISTMNVCKAT